MYTFNISFHYHGVRYSAVVDLTRGYFDRFFVKSVHPDIPLRSVVYVAVNENQLCYAVDIAMPGIEKEIANQLTNIFQPFNKKGFTREQLAISSPTPADETSVKK